MWVKLTIFTYCKSVGLWGYEEDSLMWVKLTIFRYCKSVELTVIL